MPSSVISLLHAHPTVYGVSPRHIIALARLDSPKFPSTPERCIGTASGVDMALSSNPAPASVP